MIDYARRRMPGRRTHLFVADMTQFADRMPAHSVDFAFNPINTIRHLETDAQMLQHFAEMARVLKPGGVYAVGLSLTSYAIEQPDEDLWEGTRGGCRVRQLVQYIPPAAGGRWERVISHLVVERGGRVAHSDSSYRLRCYDERQWRRLIARSTLRRIGLADVRGDPIAARTLPYAFDVLAPRG